MVPPPTDPIPHLDRDPSGEGGDPDEAAAVFDFVQAFLDDRSIGQERDLEHYLTRFSAYPDAIRAEYESLTAPTPDAPPEEQRLGHYRLIRELGRGGQGSVWIAQDEALGRVVALKLLSSWLVSGDRMARFRREAESIAKLEHEGLAVVFEADMDGAQPYIAMRYVDGEDLGTCLAEKDPLARRSFCRPEDAAGVRAALLFFERAARALHAAHEAGVVHRDIKPSNIMITQEGKPVITDFGLARDEFTPGEELITREGEVFGTPAYMSPEQISGSFGKIDRHTDIWSLGASLFETWTGRPPFEGQGQIGLARAILEDPVPDPRQLTGKKFIPHDAVVVLQTALERDIARRYSTALEFAEDLRRIREYEPIRARSAGPWLRLRRWCRREPAWATALGLLLLALTAGLIVSQIMLKQFRELLNQERSMRYVRQVPAELEKSPSRALAIGLQAVDMHDTWISRSSLFGPVDALSLAARGLLRDSRRAYDAEYFADGTRAVAAGTHGLAVYATEDGRTLAEQHSGPQDGFGVHEVVVLPDDAGLVIGTQDGRLARLGSDDLVEAWSVELSAEPIQAVELVPGRAAVLALTFDAGAFLVDTESGATLRTYPVPAESAGGAQVAPDGRSFLVSQRSYRGQPQVSKKNPAIHTVGWWDLDSGQLLAELQHQAPVLSAVFHPNEAQVWTGCENGEIKVWDAQAGSQGRPLKRNPMGSDNPGAGANATGNGQRSAAECLALSSNGSHLAVGHSRGVWLWELASETWRELPGPGVKAVQVAFDPSGQFVAACSWDNVVRVWHVKSGQLSREHRVEKRSFLLRWSPSGQSLLSAGISHFVFFWNHRRSPAGFRIGPKKHPLDWAAFTAHGERAVIADRAGRVDWIATPRVAGEAVPGETVRSLAEHGPGPVVCALAGQSPVVVSGGRDGRVVWQDLRDPSTLREQGPHVQGIRQVALAPDGQTVAFINGIGLLFLWKPGANSITRPAPIDQPYEQVTFSPDGLLVGAGDGLGNTLVWRVADGTLVMEGRPDWNSPQTTRHPVVALGFAADSSQVFAATDRYYLHTWSLDTATPVEKRDRHKWHRWMSVLPDGHVLTIGAGPGSFHASGALEPRKPATRHSDSITAFATHPEGHWIATGSKDHTVLISDWRLGTTLCRFDLHEGPITHVAFSPLPGDDRVLSTSEDGTLALWHVDPVPHARAMAPHGLFLHELRELDDWGLAEE